MTTDEARHTLWIDVPHAVTYREKGSRYDRRGYVVESVPMSIAELDPGDAPVAYRLATPDGEIAWRLHPEGGLVRHVLGPRSVGPDTGHLASVSGDGKPCDSNFLVGRVFHEYWADHPFRIDRLLELGADEVWGVSRRAEFIARPANPAVGVRAFGRFVDDGRDAAVAAALAASKDLFVVDGRLARRAPEPLIAVEILMQRGEPRSVVVRAAVPGADPRGFMAKTFFRCDQRAEAIGLARSVSARLSQDCERDVPVADELGAFSDEGLWDPTLDPRVETCRCFAVSAASTMRPSGGPAPFDEMAAFVLARMGAEGAGPAILDEAVAAIGRLDGRWGLLARAAGGPATATGDKDLDDLPDLRF